MVLIRDAGERDDGSVRRDAFLQAVSHELRTPLTSLIGFSSLLVDHYGEQLSPEALDIAERIRNSANRLEQLVEDLLDVDRLDRGLLEADRRPVPLADAVWRAVAAVRTTGRDVQVHIEPPDLQAEVDRRQFERIVENLLFNAVRHTAHGGTIVVAAGPDEEGVLLTVDDDGPGVPEDRRGAIFEPGAVPGIGVGLSLVSRFAALHGGRAWVEEREGGGASYRVALPA